MGQVSLRAISWLPHESLPRQLISTCQSKTGWSLGSVSAIDSNGRTNWIADAHRGDGKRFIVRADEKVTAFLGLGSAIRAAECPERCGGREIKMDKCRGSSKSLLDFVIRQFHLIFGRAE